MGTHIVLMNQGKVEQAGTPQEIYENPSNVFVAQFIGSPPANIIPLQDFYLGIRPEHIVISKTNSHNSLFRATVRFYEHLGSETIYHLDGKLGELTVKSPNGFEKIDGEVFVTFDPDKVMFFNAQGDAIQEKITAYYDVLLEQLQAPLK